MFEFKLLCRIDSGMVSARLGTEGGHQLQKDGRMYR